jgi:hypothetical protein
MVRQTAKSAWDTVLKYIRDIIYIGLFLLAIGSSIMGWTRARNSESVEAQILKDAVENNTAAMNELKDELKNINTFLLDQKELNGQFKEFMDNEKRKGN